MLIIQNCSASRCISDIENILNGKISDSLIDDLKQVQLFYSAPFILLSFINDYSCRWLFSGMLVIISLLPYMPFLVPLMFG